MWCHTFGELRKQVCLLNVAVHCGIGEAHTWLPDIVSFVVKWQGRVGSFCLIISGLGDFLGESSDFTLLLTHENKLVFKNFSTYRTVYFLFLHVVQCLYNYDFILKSITNIHTPMQLWQSNNFFFFFFTRHDLQTHVDDMQTTIDNLQDFLTNANLNVDPSMLHSVSKDTWIMLPFVE